MFSLTAAVSGEDVVSITCSECTYTVCHYTPIVGSCTTTMTYVFFVISSRTAVNSGSSISREWNSSRRREQECLKALISSEVRSYRVGSNACCPCCVSVWDDEGDVGDDGEGEGGEEVELRALEEVAITRKVVRSKRMTSVALQASANVVKCRVSTAALGIKVCTMLDHAFNKIFQLQ